ncbi:MAG: hypothetical protein ACKN85_10915, partial [Pirellula sp.]
DHEHRFTEHEHEVTGAKTSHVLPAIIPEEPLFIRKLFSRLFGSHAKQPSGRATVKLLNMNATKRAQLRRNWNELT